MSTGQHNSKEENQLWLKRTQQHGFCLNIVKRFKVKYNINFSVQNKSGAMKGRQPFYLYVARRPHATGIIKPMFASAKQI